MNKLLKIVEEKKARMEYGTATIKGVKLSRADLDMVEYYILTCGRGMMRPVGNVGLVLEKFGYQHYSF